MTAIDLSCDGISDDEETLIRDVISRVADKWALWILHVLSEGGTLRFSRVREQVDGISQKMLTKTLRQLERDGFVTRTMFLEVPPRVEYALTPLGENLLRNVAPLWHWLVGSAAELVTARQRFDEAQRTVA
jgi:DNA-binding HxlR family transcriptional regulator